MYIIAATLFIFAIYMLTTPNTYYVLRKYDLSIVVTVQSAECTPDVSARQFSYNKPFWIAMLPTSWYRALSLRKTVNRARPPDSGLCWGHTFRKTVNRARPADSGLWVRGNCY